MFEYGVVNAKVKFSLLLYTRPSTKRDLVHNYFSSVRGRVSRLRLSSGLPLVGKSAVFH